MERRLYLFSLVVLSMLFGMQISGMEQGGQQNADRVSRLEKIAAEKIADMFYKNFMAAQMISDKISAIGALTKQDGDITEKAKFLLVQALKDRMPVTLKRTYNRYVLQPNVVHTLGHESLVKSVAISPDGQYVVTGSVDRTARIWNMATGALKHTLEGHTNEISSVAISPDGQYVVTGSRDNTARIWNMATGALKHTLEGHTNEISSVAISPDGQYVVTGSRDDTARIWNMATGALKHTLQGHTHWITSVAISPDGQYVVTGSVDRTARIWNMATGALVRVLQGHTHWVTSVAISPDGQYVVTGSADRTARIWNMATGALKHTLQGHTNWVTSVAISPDGQYVVTGDSMARIWQIQENVLDHDEAQQLSLEQIILLTIYADAKSINPAVTFNDVRNMYSVKNIDVQGAKGLEIIAREYQQQQQQQMLQAIFDSAQSLSNELKKFMGIPTTTTTTTTTTMSGASSSRDTGASSSSSR